MHNLGEFTIHRTTITTDFHIDLVHFDLQFLSIHSGIQTADEFVKIVINIAITIFFLLFTFGLKSIQSSSLLINIIIDDHHIAQYLPIASVTTLTTPALRITDARRRLSTTQNTTFSLIVELKGIFLFPRKVFFFLFCRLTFHAIHKFISLISFISFIIIIINYLLVNTNLLQ